MAIVDLPWREWNGGTIVDQGTDFIELDPDHTTGAEANIAGGGNYRSYDYFWNFAPTGNAASSVARECWFLDDAGQNGYGCVTEGNPGVAATYLYEMRGGVKTQLDGPVSGVVDSSGLPGNQMTLSDTGVVLETRDAFTITFLFASNPGHEPLREVGLIRCTGADTALGEVRRNFSGGPSDLIPAGDPGGIQLHNDTGTLALKGDPPNELLSVEAAGFPLAIGSDTDTIIDGLYMPDNPRGTGGSMLVVSESPPRVRWGFIGQEQLDPGETVTSPALVEGETVTGI